MSHPGGGERCVEPLSFPKRLYNRPALARIDYRLGSYADIRRALLRELDGVSELRHWTHRGPDDPGIALLEGVAIVGDVLTFYQDLYANEAYLRTAAWRESVADLVRLLGYRLSPGLGGRGTFAVEVKGDATVTVPAGFPMQAELEELEQPAKFETTESIVAHPGLSRFELHRPLAEPLLAQGATAFRIVDDAGVELQADDRLLVGRPSAGNADDWVWSQIAVVDSTSQLHGATIVQLKGELRFSPSQHELAVYKLGRSFRHFGHGAPPQEIELVGEKAQATTVTYARALDGDTTESFLDRSLRFDEFPLDAAVDDFAAGGQVACVIGPTLYGAWSDDDLLPLVWIVFGPKTRTRIRQVESVQPLSMRWGSLSGPSTMLTLASTLASADLNAADVKATSFEEIVSPRLRARAAPVDDAALASGVDLFFSGPEELALKLTGRRVLLDYPDKPARVTAVSSVTPDDSAVAELAGLHRVTLAETVSYAEFPQADGAVAVFGNLVDADQGKTEKTAVLGNGDARRAFQTFPLPKAPLTYLYAPSETPPESPELEVRVDGRLWSRVDSLFGQGGAAEVYVVRQDADGKSWVQFGDGKELGARLTSGVGNVTALYRSGSGAHGPAKPDTKVQAQSRLDKLDKIRLLSGISGGSEPETGDKARRAAPGRVQSLDRLVALADYETETLALSGVVAARARWALHENVPSVSLTVLMESGREAEFEAIKEIIGSNNASRGPDRFPVRVVAGAIVHVYLDARFALAGGANPDSVMADARAALGVVAMDGTPAGTGSGGLFSLDRRTFGDREYATRIAATLQNVDGVAWAEIEGFKSLGSGPLEELALPSAPVRHEVVDPGANGVLKLAEREQASPLTLTIVAGATGGSADG